MVLLKLEEKKNFLIIFLQLHSMEKEKKEVKIESSDISKQLVV